MEEKIEKKPINLKVLRFFTFLIMAIVTALMTLWIVDIIGATGGEKAIKLTFFAIYGLIILGMVGYGISLIFAVIGLIIAIVNKRSRNGKLSQLVLQIVITILPIVLWFLFLLISKSV